MCGLFFSGKTASAEVIDLLDEAGNNHDDDDDGDDDIQQAVMQSQDTAASLQPARVSHYMLQEAPSQLRLQQRRWRCCWPCLFTFSCMPIIGVTCS